MDLAALERRGSNNRWSVGCTWVPSTGQCKKNRPRQEVFYEYVMLSSSGADAGCCPGCPGNHFNFCFEI